MNKIYTKVWSLAWPMMLSNISIPLLGIVDTAILGHLDTPAYLAAVAIGASVTAFIFTGLNFFRLGTVGLSAQAHGSNDPQSAHTLLGKTGLLAILTSLVIMLASPLLANLSTLLMNTPLHLQAFTQEYIQIRLLAAPASLLVFVIVGWSIGQQNTRLAMIVITSTSLVNILLDYYLVLQLNLNSRGAAIASAVAELAGLLVAIICLLVYFPSVRQASFKTLTGPGIKLSDMLKTNGNLFIRSSCLLFVFAFFHAQGARLGESILAANAILLQLIMLQSYTLDGFANATEALTGKAKGQNSQDNLQLALKATAMYTFATCLLLVTAFLLLETHIILLFTDQEELVRYVSGFFIWVALMPIISCWSYWLDGVAIGLSESRLMRNGMLLACWGIFIPCWYITLAWGNLGLWLSFSIFILARAIFLSPVLFTRVKNGT